MTAGRVSPVVPRRAAVLEEDYSDLLVPSQKGLFFDCLHWHR